MLALEKAPLALPTPVLGPPADADGLALVVPGFASGALLLRAEDGALVRLSWEAEAESDRRRALAPGHYELVGYRLLARDVRGVEWHLSAGGAVLRELDLDADTETRVTLDSTIEFRPGLTPEGVRVAVQGEAGAGLSIYRAGRRIPLHYRLRDSGGRELAHGKINYG